MNEDGKKLIIKVWVNCPSEEVADEIAVHLLEQGLISSANRYGAIISRFSWRGQIEVAREIPLLLKTREDHFQLVSEGIRSIHPYETPSILSIKVDQANAEYLDWVLACTHPDSGG